MPSQGNKGVFDTSIKAFLQAMQKAKKIKPGGRLVPVNRRNGAVVMPRDLGEQQ